ncbi:hypothetical protein JMJ55_18135 [Belnapia sp. T6]|uniref:Uncharacterized protein n=1 Tax=Belnapia mucosa TaxID=2804532 RepID=A0ABS1V6E3_9PROT|nr:hypothetical protein [Belnapia mucosa]MBL6457258.1 hypothetical protein [Belnapia mucosa]
MAHPAPIRVNRAPVLTLWATVVAERLGHPPDTALSLGSAVAGTAARAKARRLGLAEEHPHAEGGAARPRRTTRLLGRDIPLAHDKDGVELANAGGHAAPAAPVAAYLARAFGPRLAEARAAMEALAAGLEPEELNRIGFRLYEAFRPEVPEDVRGWGAKGELRLERIAAAAG